VNQGDGPHVGDDANAGACCQSLQRSRMGAGVLWGSNALPLRRGAFLAVAWMSQTGLIDHV
jgi:hypothetical protein